MSRYRYVSAMKAEGFPVEAACEAAEVSTSAYYDWLATRRRPHRGRVGRGAPGQRDDRQSTADPRRHLRSPRMTGELRRRGFCVNHKRIERLMADHGIYARDGRRRKVRTTIPDVSAPPLPDLVKRDFASGEPGQRDLRGHHLHPAPTKAGSTWPTCSISAAGGIVGFAMDEHMPTELVAERPRHGHRQPGVATSTA